MNLGHCELGREDRGGRAARSHSTGGLDLDLAIGDLVDEATGNGGAGDADGGGEGNCG